MGLFLELLRKEMNLYIYSFQKGPFSTDILPHVYYSVIRVELKSKFELQLFWLGTTYVTRGSKNVYRPLEMPKHENWNKPNKPKNKQINIRAR